MRDRRTQHGNTARHDAGSPRAVIIRSNGLGTEFVAALPPGQAMQRAIRPGRLVDRARSHSHDSRVGGLVPHLPDSHGRATAGRAPTERLAHPLGNKRLRPPSGSRPGFPMHDQDPRLWTNEPEGGRRLLVLSLHGADLPLPREARRVGLWLERTSAAFQPMATLSAMHPMGRGRALGEPGEGTAPE